VTGDAAALVRAALAAATDRDAREFAALSDDTPLLDASGIGLDSLGGARLLAAVLESTGVDVAAEDLGLDALETVGTLVAFIEDRLDA